MNSSDPQLVQLTEVRTEQVFGLLDGARWYPGRGLVFADMTKGGVYALSWS
jgi:D-xylonolactonase